MKQWLLITAAVCAIPAAAVADETLKYRTVYHLTSTQSQDVHDVDGHTLLLVSASGLASLPDGSVGLDNFVATLDYTKGSGPAITYGSVTFHDGSVIYTKYVGMTTAEGAKVTFKGTLTILGGKGKYEGAKGDGTATGARMQPMPGAGAQLYTDVVLNIKK
jgi:hypothetical protein